MDLSCVQISHSPHHRHARVYPSLFVAVDDTAVLDGAVIDPVGETGRVPRKLLRARLRVNPLAPTIVDLHLQTDEIPLQLWHERIVETVAVGGDHVGDGDPAGAPVELDGVVGGVALGLQTTVLRRALSLVVDRDPKRVGVLEGRQKGYADV